MNSHQHVNERISLREGFLSCDDVMLDSTILLKHPGGNTSWREPTMNSVQGKRSRALCEYLYADGTLIICNQNPMNLSVQHQVSRDMENQDCRRELLVRA